MLANFSLLNNENPQLMARSCKSEFFWGGGGGGVVHDGANLSSRRKEANFYLLAKRDEEKIVAELNFIHSVSRDLVNVNNVLFGSIRAHVF